MQGPNLHLLIVLLFFGFSAISWVIGKLREQAAIKKARDEMKRARDEQLRTGRSPEPEPTKLSSAASTRASELNELRELAAKRQRQLQQMREMQQQSVRAQRSTVQSSPAPTSREPRPVPVPIPGIPLPGPKSGLPGGMTGPGVPRQPGPVNRRPPSQGTGAGGGIQDIRPGQPPMRPKPPRQRAMVEEQAAPAYRVVEQAVPRRLVSDAAAPGNEIGGATEGRRRAAPIGLAALLGRNDGGRVSAAEVRRAVMLAEIFGPPVSARRPDPGPMGG